MYLVKRKIAFGLLLVCYIAFVVAASEDAGKQTASQNHYAHEAAVAGSRTPWAEKILEAQGAPPMAMLLTRLHGVRSYLMLLESERAINLSTSLTVLSESVEQQFARRLYTPYLELSQDHRKIYSEVMQVVLELETMMDEVENAGAMPAYEVDLNLTS